VVSCRSARCFIWIPQTVHSRGGAFGTLFLGIASRRGLQCTPKQFVVLWFVHRVRRIAINAAKLTSAGFYQHESHWSAALFAGGRWRVLGHRVARAGSGGSTKLSVTDNYRSWAMIIQHAHFGSKIASLFRMITLLRLCSSLVMKRSPLQSSIALLSASRLAFPIASLSSAQVRDSYPSKLPSNLTAYAR
jgi:hypothetical protein